MSLLIGFLIIFFGYQIYERQNIEQYSERGAALVNGAGEVVNWDKIPHYANTLEEDAEYAKTLEEMRTIAHSGGVEYLYVLYPVDEHGAIFIYDTDESEDRCELGYYTDWETEFGDMTDELLNGEEIEPFIEETDWGWILSIYVPFTDSEGNFAGYLGVDYPAETLLAEQNKYILQLSIVAIIVTVIITLIFLFILDRLVLRPINEIVSAAENYSIDNVQGKTVTSDSFSQLNIATRDELETLDRSLKYMDSTIKEYIDNLEHAEKRAETDSMTGLLNRVSYEDYGSLTLNRTQGIAHAFLMIDLDEFKTVNDTYGHATGDAVIEACVKTIQTMFRSTDLVARLGGDEFAVFCNGPITFENAEKRAIQLCENIRQVRVEDKISFSVSVGVLYFNTAEVTSYQSLYMQADEALYEAKENGRDGYVIKSYVPIVTSTDAAEEAEKEAEPSNESPAANNDSDKA
ncbi:MAG: GGDEF domain-containing protein [Raoultibacter sp.]